MYNFMWSQWFSQALTELPLWLRTKDHHQQLFNFSPSRLTEVNQKQQQIHQHATNITPSHSQLVQYVQVLLS